jgi:hypothetical protein
MNSGLGSNPTLVNGSSGAYGSGLPKAGGNAGALPGPESWPTIPGTVGKGGNTNSPYSGQDGASGLISIRYPIT